jgi:hypothetical protein
MLVQHQDQLLGSGSKVVITSTKIKTAASARGTRSKCFKPLISIILKPIGISNPAKTDSGIYAANEPKPKSTASKNKP